MTRPAQQLSIGQVAEVTGLSAHTLRLYEREGLIATRVQRCAKGRRVYTDDDVQWLIVCTRFRAAGMPLADIRRYAALVRQGPGNEDQRLDLLRQHRQYVQGRIAELTESLDLISHKVRVYEKHIAEGTTGQLWNPTNEPPGNN